MAPGKTRGKRWRAKMSKQDGGALEMLFGSCVNTPAAQKRPISHSEAKPSRIKGILVDPEENDGTLECRKQMVELSEGCLADV